MLLEKTIEEINQVKKEVVAIYDTLLNNEVYEKVLYVPGSYGIIDTFYDGRTSVNKKTFEEVKKEYPNIKLLSWSEFLKEQKKNEDENIITGPQEITEEKFNDMLEILPPKNLIVQGSFIAFMMCEYFTSNITNYYIKTGGKYYTATKRDTTSYRDLIEEINQEKANELELCTK
jgi:hypothetical protein